MTQRPVEQQESASAFYAALDMDVSYFPAIWHTYKVGHLLASGLDRICRNHGVSMADIHLLGAVRLDTSGQQRATDLAHALNVSNAVLSTRISKLERKGLLARLPSTADRRAFTLRITQEGLTLLDAVIAKIGESSHFVQCYRRLSDQDRATLARIMGDLHDALDRDFIAASRGTG